MERLGAPLRTTALYILLVGLSTLAPGLVRAVWGYTVTDNGVLLVLSATFLGFGVVLWGIAGNPQKHADLAIFVVASLVISIVFLLWGLGAHLFTARNVVVALIVDIALILWIWSAKSRT